jgi:hypothetical protein
MSFWTQKIISGGGGGMTQVYTDSTLTGLGTAISPLSVVNVYSFPNMTTTARLALSPANGTTVFDTTIGAPYIYFGGSWYDVQVSQ